VLSNIAVHHKAIRLILLASALVFSINTIGWRIVYAEGINSVQPELGWTQYRIEDVGEIWLPPTMEQQSGAYRHHTDRLKGRMGIRVPVFTGQQKGLNDFRKEALTHYVRVMLSVTQGEPGDFASLSFDLSQISQPDIIALNKYYEKAAINELLGIGQRLIRWNGTSLRRINGMSSINFSYIRQMGDHPPVLVSRYIFQDDDRAYVLTLSSRMTESTLWEKDLQKVLMSFRVNKNI